MEYFLRFVRFFLWFKNHVQLSINDAVLKFKSNIYRINFYFCSLRGISVNKRSNICWTNTRWIVWGVILWAISKGYLCTSRHGKLSVCKWIADGRSKILKRLWNEHSVTSKCGTDRDWWKIYSYSKLATPANNPFAAKSRVFPEQVFPRFF